MPPDQTMTADAPPDARPMTKAARRARKALRSLNRHFFEQFLFETLSVTAPPSKHVPAALMGAWLTMIFREQACLVADLFAKVRAGEHRGALSWAQKEEENFHQELTSYIQLLLRPITVKNHAVTSMHQLLAMLVPYCIDDPSELALWKDLTVCRLLPGTAASRPAAQAGLTGPVLAGRLKRLCRREENLQARARAEGKPHGYLPGSASPTAIARAGQVYLCLPNGWHAPVPEELRLGDVLNLLPAPLTLRLFSAYDQDRVLIAQTKATLGGNDRTVSDDKTIKHLHANGGLSHSFTVYEAIEDIFSTLNDPYATKVINTGLPSAIGLKLGRTTAEGLQALREKAVETAKTNRRPVTLADWEPAWSGMGGVAGYKGFADFARSEAGQFLMHGQTVASLPETEGPGLIVSPTEVSLGAEIAAWEKRNNLTAAEAFALRWALDWNHSGAHHLQTALNSPAFPKAVAPTLAGEFPYRLIANPDERFKLFRFFFVRRAAILLDRGEVDGLPTLAETIVRGQTRKKPVPSAEWPMFAARLHGDTELAAALRKQPYCWAPAGARLDLLLFFYTRDIETLTRRPA